MKRRLASLLMALMMLMSAMIMAGCTDSKDTDSSEDGLRAADPMTEEEIENDDSGGCIEDSEDLLN